MNTKQSARLKGKRRPGDPWISKNRVLNPTKSKRNIPIYRNPNFDTDETKLLIHLWGDPKVQRELITTHKKHVVIAQLASKMEEYGYYRSPEEITTRIKNMKCFYNRLKKEMELNKNLDPSWRHYADMEAIMTRPIFSVRPNEVPAPSLKYLMEQEEEKRKERKRKAEKEGVDLSDSDEDIEDVLAVSVTRRRSKSKDNECVEPDAELELELDDATLAAIERGADSPGKQSKGSTNKDKSEMDEEMMIKMEIESEEFQAMDAHETLSKSKDTTNNDDDCQLLIPKIEPIDVDDDSQNADQTTGNVSKVQKNAAPHLLGILNQPTKSTTNGPTFTLAKFSMSQNSMTNTITTSSAVSASCSTPSKISVVSPTILMPSTGQTMPGNTAQSPRQMRIGGNLQALLTGPGARQTVTATNGMKFILVNTTDRRGPPLTTTTLPMAPTTTTNPPQQCVNVVQAEQTQQPQQKQQPTSARLTKSLQNILPKSNIFANSSRKRTTETSTERESFRKRDLAGIKSTLQKLLRAKEDSNELQSQRLAIERERLQFERTIAEKFVGIFEQNQKIQQQLVLQQQQQAQQRTATQQIFTTTNAGMPTGTMQNPGQMMMPPKLLITTMVPTSSAAGSVTGGVNTSSKVLTAANFKNLTASINVDKPPLLIPKEEPNN